MAPEDRFGIQGLVVISCAHWHQAVTSARAPGCPPAMDRVDTGSASSEYQFTLYRSCFTSSDVSGRSDHAG